MAKETSVLNTELEDLPPELRWREWMGRIEAVIFASASPVPRGDLARVVGQEASVDLLIEDIQSRARIKREPDEHGHCDQTRRKWYSPSATAFSRSVCHVITLTLAIRLPLRVTLARA